MNGKTDRRAARTKNALMQAMLKLLSQKEIAKITVSELAELADIGRGTFYLHYTDPYDLLDKLEEETLESVTRNTPMIAEQWNADGLLNHLEGDWRYIYENMDVFKVLTNRLNGVRFMEKFRRYCERTALSARQADVSLSQEERYGIIYIIYGTLGVFQRWMEEGAPIPPDRLAHMMRNLIRGREE